jgi:hypothetical protein
MKLNESELIEKEITLRNVRLTNEVLETRRSSIRWLALSLGVLNPGESRLSAVAILDALVHFQFVKKTDPEVKELMDYINANWETINEKTLRYHLLRMKKMGLIENSQGKFYFKPPSIGDRYDAGTWSLNLFKSDYDEIAKKIDEVIKSIKSKNSGGV